LMKNRRLRMRDLRRSMRAAAWLVHCKIYRPSAAVVAPMVEARSPRAWDELAMSSVAGA
jgi:hypothetical protein